MFERFTDTARHVVVQAQEDARRLGHHYIGCEHLLLAVAATDEPASSVLRDQGVTPERIEAEFLRIIGRGQAADPLAGQMADPLGGQAADPLAGLDAQALAAIGIDLDIVRARIEATFGPDALTRPGPAACRSRRPAWRKGPLAELARRRRRRRARHHAFASAAPTGNAPSGSAPSGSAPHSPGPPPKGHIPFTPRAKKTLQIALREAQALNDNYIGVQHLTLALLGHKDGIVPAILSGLGTPAASLRAAVLARYRKAS